MPTYRKVFACKIVKRFMDNGTLRQETFWLDLGIQCDSETHEPQRTALLDSPKNDWRKIELYEYGGNKPSVKDCAGDYVTTLKA